VLLAAVLVALMGSSEAAPAPVPVPAPAPTFWFVKGTLFFKRLSHEKSYFRLSLVFIYIFCRKKNMCEKKFRSIAIKHLLLGRIKF
jgi:hypothetical protein